MNTATENKQRKTENGNRLIPLGVITTVHGIRGEVKIRSFTADPEDITSYGPLTDKAGKRTFDVKVTSHTKDVLIASIKGITTREDAEKLRNIELCVPRSALPAADDDEYYYEDLVGVKVFTAEGNAYGTITALHNFGAGDLVIIRLESGADDIMPFTKATFPNINIKEGKATIELPTFIKQEE